MRDIVNYNDQITERAPLLLPSYQHSETSTLLFVEVPADLPIPPQRLNSPHDFHFPKPSLAEPPLPCMKPQSSTPTIVWRRQNGIQLRRCLLLVQGAPAGAGASAFSMFALTPGWVVFSC